MFPFRIRTLLIAGAVGLGLIAAILLVGVGQESGDDADSGVTSSGASSSSSSALPCGASSSSRRSHSSDASGASTDSNTHSSSSSEPGMHPCPGAGTAVWMQQVSSTLPDPTKPSAGKRTDPLRDPRLEPYFPLRITAMNDGESMVVEYQDAESFRMMLPDGEVVTIRGRSFMNIPGEGWVTMSSATDDHGGLLTFLNIFGLLLDDPYGLGFHPTERMPCVIATDRECDTFLRDSDGMKVWAHNTTHLLDHWEDETGNILSVEYDAAFSPVVQPSHFRDIDAEMRQMMQMNGMSGY